MRHFNDLQCPSCRSHTALERQLERRLPIWCTSNKKPANIKKLSSEAERVSFINAISGDDACMTAILANIGDSYKVPLHSAAAPKPSADGNVGMDVHEFDCRENLQHTGA